MAEHAILLMKLTGPTSDWIKGESEVKIKGKTDGAPAAEWIELADWNWSLDQKEDREGSLEPSVFSFGKLMDRATTPMLKAMVAGEALKAEIVMEDTLGGYFQVRLVLEDVRIAGYSFDTEIEDAHAEITEKWKFNYEKIEVGVRDDPKEGVKSVELKRPAGASTDAPGGVAEQIRKLVDKMSPGDLDKVWAQLKKDFVDKGRYGDDKAKPKGQG